MFSFKSLLYILIHCFLSFIYLLLMKSLIYSLIDSKLMFKKYLLRAHPRTKYLHCRQRNQHGFCFGRIKFIAEASQMDFSSNNTSLSKTYRYYILHHQKLYGERQNVSILIFVFAGFFLQQYIGCRLTWGLLYLSKTQSFSEMKKIEYVYGIKNILFSILLYE